MQKTKNFSRIGEQKLLEDFLKLQANPGKKKFLMPIMIFSFTINMTFLVSSTYLIDPLIKTSLNLSGAYSWLVSLIFIISAIVVLRRIIISTHCFLDKHRHYKLSKNIIYMFSLSLAISTPIILCSQGIYFTINNFWIYSTIFGLGAIIISKFIVKRTPKYRGNPQKWNIVQKLAFREKKISTLISKTPMMPCFFLRRCQNMILRIIRKHNLSNFLLLEYHSFATKYIDHNGCRLRTAVILKENVNLQNNVHLIFLRTRLLQFSNLLLFDKKNQYWRSFDPLYGHQILRYDKESNTFKVS